MPFAPLFTIAIPTYNRIDSLKSALDSALNQDIKPLSYEIIVVENTDDFYSKSPTQTMLEREYKHKITYYKNKKI